MVPQYVDGPALVREPFHCPGWGLRGKVDGWRIIAYKEGESVRLVSRHGVDHTKRFARPRGRHREAVHPHGGA